MNRRKFFRWLGLGTAVVVAPAALVPEGPVCVETCCSCSGRSFWEGECDYCTAHPRPRPLLTWVDYQNFSSFSVACSIDPKVADASSHFADSAARGIKELYDAVHD
jgi:hypothetical protein